MPCRLARPEARHGSAARPRTLRIWARSGAPVAARDRGALRLRRDAPKAGGLGAMSGPPCESTNHPINRSHERVVVEVLARGLERHHVVLERAREHLGQALDGPALGVVHTPD